MRNFFVFTVSCLAIAPLALAQQYVGTVLYPLTTPNGYYGGDAEILQSSVAGQTVGWDQTLTYAQHAALWSAPDGVATDLNPAGFANSDAFATNGVQQVGGAGNGPGFTPDQDQAMLWSGTAASAVNLNPGGFTYSIAYGIAGNQQVGKGEGSITGNNDHALLWSGTAASAVDLNPVGFTNSVAFGAAGNRQVGSGDGHALLWSGIAASAIDLNPAGFIYSDALGIAGNQQVGDGSISTTNYNYHALLWSGTATSALDLNPVGFTNSVALDTNGNQQVGYGQFSTVPDEALFWSGTAASAIQLQALLPSAGTWDDSWASSIDASGNVFGYADGTLDGLSGGFAVEWSPIPEPASLSILAVYASGLLRHRRPCR
jgi:hypothetical protein